MQNQVRTAILAHQRKDLRIDVSRCRDFGGSAGSTAAVQFTLSRARPRSARRRTPATCSRRCGRSRARSTSTRTSSSGRPSSASPSIASARPISASTCRRGEHAPAPRRRASRCRRTPITARSTTCACAPLGDYRADARGLSLITVPSTKVGRVPLDAIVQIRTDLGPLADQPPRSPAPGHADVQRRRRGTARARSRRASSRSSRTSTCALGYGWRPPAARRRRASAAKGFLIAFALSFIFMYLVLAAQFESWLHPVTILISPAADGAVRARCRSSSSGRAINIFSTLGLLVLFGVVKKNSILQVDHTNHLRARGHGSPRGDPPGEPRSPAAHPDDDDRVRGRHAPAASSRAASARATTAASAGVIVGGQTLSLLLTLLATPVFYSLFDDVGSWIKRTRKRIEGGEEPVVVPAEHPAE